MKSLPSALRLFFHNLLLLAALTVSAEVPPLIHYQGRVTVSGVNFDGKGQFKFALITTNKLGVSVTLWSNNGSSAGGAEPSVPVVLGVSQGLYSVLLGDTSIANMSVLPASVFKEPVVWLRVWFNDGKNGSQRITPDQRIAAVGYAMMAATVADGAVTSEKLAPGAALSNLPNGSLPALKLTPGNAAGQVLITDTSGTAKWVGPAALADFIGRPEHAIPDTNENSVDVEITGIMTNKVVVVNGPAMEIEERRLWDPDNGVRGLKPEAVNMLPFVFEYAGSAESKFVSVLNTPRIPMPLHTITLLIRDTNGVIRARWKLNSMELTRIDPGNDGRMRYTFASFDTPRRGSPAGYDRTPEGFPINHPNFQPGSSDPVIEISGIDCGGNVTTEVDSRNQTLTLTFDYPEAGQAFAWFKSTVAYIGEDFIDNKAMSVIRHDGVNPANGFLREIARINYYEIYPIRYEQVSGFSRVDKLKERIVIRYLVREKS